MKPPKTSSSSETSRKREAEEDGQLTVKRSRPVTRAEILNRPVSQHASSQQRLTRISEEGPATDRGTISEGHELELEKNKLQQELDALKNLVVEGYELKQEKASMQQRLDALKNIETERDALKEQKASMQLQLDSLKNLVTESNILKQEKASLQFDNKYLKSEKEHWKRKCEEAESNMKVFQKTWQDFGEGSSHRFKALQELLQEHLVDSNKQLESRMLKEWSLFCQSDTERFKELEIMVSTSSQETATSKTQVLEPKRKSDTSFSKYYPSQSVMSPRPRRNPSGLGDQSKRISDSDSD